MAINSADKIFVDVNDEINFVVEKILGSEQSRVIVALPQNALVASSLVSMKVLAKQITKSKKMVVIVTEDSFGMQLAERSGLVSVNKVSSITPETWEVAAIKKERSKAAIENQKQSLLADRGILPSVESPESLNTTEPTLEHTTDLEPNPTSDDSLEVAESNPDDDSQDLDEGEVITEDEDQIDDTPEAEQEVRGAIQRKRRPGKMVTISGIQIFAGGDIANMGVDKSANITTDFETSEQLMDEDTQLEDETRGGITRKKASFTGRDWTSATRDVSSKSGGGISNLLSLGSDSISSVRDGFVTRVLKSKVLWGSVVGIGLVVGVAIYFLAFVLASVEIRLELKTTDVPVEQQIITADSSYLDVDVEKLVIPARIVSSEVTGSISGDATGTGTRGEKAAGLIDIWNKTTSAKTIKAGSKITSAQTGLVYIIADEVQLPAGEERPDGVTIEPGTVEVRIEASKVGPEYNIPASDDVNVSFKLEGIATSNIEGKRFAEISGGSKEEFVSVSKQDVSKRKDVLLERLQSEALADIRSQVGSDEVLLQDSQEFEEIELVATPDIGEEAEEFDLDLILGATAIAVRREHLDTAIAGLVEQQQQTDINFEVDGLSGSSIENVVRNKEVASFNVSSSGSITSKVDENEIKDALAGLDIQSAQDYLNFEVPEINSARIIYSPGIVPDFLKRIPSDLTKILIVTSK